MVTTETGHTRRISITKLQRSSAVALELIALCQSVTEDGRLTTSEIEWLRDWLTLTDGVDLPAHDYLHEVVDRVLEDGVVTAEESTAVYRAVEAALPPDVRAAVVAARRSVETQTAVRTLAEKTLETEQGKAERQRQREEARLQKELSRPVCPFNFMVAGVLHGNRAHTIDEHLHEDDAVYLARDPGNRYSRNAIEVRLANGMQIGFVPEEFARRYAPLLDQGLPHRARVLRILDGARAPIPIIVGGIYKAGAPVGGLTLQCNVPPRAAV